MANCEDLVWPVLSSALEESTIITGDDGDCRVTVPFERADRDAINLWIKERSDGEFVITDEGETYGFLYLSNVKLDQNRREKRLMSTKQRYELESAKYEITLKTTKEQLGFRLLDAIQAVQSISYLAYTRRQYTQTDFREEVGDYLERNDYTVDWNIEVSGGSKSHRVDFQVHNGVPTYLEAIHAEDVSTANSIAERTAFKWTDIQAGMSDVKTISVLDDESGEYDDETVKILTNYSDVFVHWTARDQLIQAIG